TNRDIPLGVAAKPAYSRAALPGETYRFLLRMPEELRRALAAAAARSGRSLNAEVVHRLEQSLRMSPLRVAANTAAAVTKQLIELRRGRVLRKRYRIAIVAVVIAGAI